MTTPLGLFVKNADLVPVERELVALAWQGADRAYCHQSNFPVGAAIRAVNAAGESKVFVGCNVENDTFPATICAERNAATTAVVEGYTRFTHVAVLCKKYPGGSPCGLCRQVLREFGCDAVLLNVCDHDSNVRRASVGELLPKAAGASVEYGGLVYNEKTLIDRAIALSLSSHVPYSKKPRGAVACATNAEGKRRRFYGTQIDNASYGGSMSAERVAVGAAITAGFKNITRVAVFGETAVDGECLQVMREFGGLTAEVVLIAPDKSIVRATVDEMLPDSFGPECL